MTRLERLVDQIWELDLPDLVGTARMAGDAAAAGGPEGAGPPLPPPEDHSSANRASAS